MSLRPFAIFFPNRRRSNHENPVEHWNQSKSSMFIRIFVFSKNFYSKKKDSWRRSIIKGMPWSTRKIIEMWAESTNQFRRIFLSSISVRHVGFPNDRCSENFIVWDFSFPMNRVRFQDDLLEKSVAAEKRNDLKTSLEFRLQALDEYLAILKSEIEFYRKQLWNFQRFLLLLFRWSRHWTSKIVEKQNSTRSSCCWNVEETNFWTAKSCRTIARFSTAWSSWSVENFLCLFKLAGRTIE